MTLTGKCSEFGGKDDEGMFKDTGLAVYEPHEADRRPDIFYEEDPKWIEEHPEWAKANPDQRQPTWARLRTYFYYIAIKYDKAINRKVWQNTPWKITNPENGDWCTGFIVDWGPGADGRVVDLSPGIMKRLQLKTDQIVKVERFNV